MPELSLEHSLFLGKLNFPADYDFLEMDLCVALTPNSLSVTTVGKEGMCLTHRMSPQTKLRAFFFSLNIAKC